MQKLPLLLVVFLFTIEANLQADSAVRPTTRVGNTVFLEKFEIPQLARSTTIVVQLPANYETSDQTRYPVLYMMDGQNLFDEATAYKGEWHIDEYIQQRAISKPTAGLIVVGIYNSAFRESEYIPFDYYKDSKKTIVRAEGAKYSEFIVKTLKPYIDSHFQTLGDPDHTGIGGSSFGAYLAYYLFWVYPEIFGRTMVFSMVNVPLVDRTVPERLSQDLVVRNLDRSHQKAFAEIGKVELGWTKMSDQQLLDNAISSFTGMGLKPESVDVFLDPNGEHNEETWAQAFPKAIEWLFD